MTRRCRRPSRRQAVTATLLLVSLGVVLAGCATRQISPSEDGQAAWKRFQAGYRAAPAGNGLLLGASMLYSRVDPIKRTNLIQLSIWGDFQRPLRLDAKAGIGTSLAHVREDDAGLLVFYPQDNVAYVHSDPVLGATRLGLPFPFSLEQLARVAANDFSGLTSADYRSVRREGDHYIYELKDGPVHTVALALDGRPDSLYGTASTGDHQEWVMEITGYDTDPAVPTPRRITLRLADGEKGVLRIKALELKVEPWPDSAMKLDLPENVAVRQLDATFDPAMPPETPDPLEDAP